jgi:hypothetical protein
MGKSSRLAGFRDGFWEAEGPFVTINAAVFTKTLSWRIVGYPGTEALSVNTSRLCRNSGLGITEGTRLRLYVAREEDSNKSGKPVLLY